MAMLGQLFTWSTTTEKEKKTSNHWKCGHNTEFTKVCAGNNFNPQREDVSVNEDIL